MGSLTAGARGWLSSHHRAPLLTLHAESITGSGWEN